MQNSCYPVLSGLEAGEQLVTSHLLSLRQGTAVKPKADQAKPAVIWPCRSLFGSALQLRECSAAAITEFSLLAGDLESRSGCIGAGRFGPGGWLRS